MNSINLADLNNIIHELTFNKPIVYNDNIITESPIIILRKPYHKEIQDIIEKFELFGPIKNFQYESDTNELLLVYENYINAKTAYEYFCSKYDISFVQLEEKINQK